ncbi:MAG: ATP synthase subunit I [Porticoccus sp.]|nr:ATP synthase subunit I [Porticoccus sp.]
MVVDWESVLLGVFFGVPVSTLFFAGLAWSVQRALKYARPSVLLLLSFVCRMTMLLGIGFWLTTSGDNAWSLIGYALAFFLVRLVVVLWIKSTRPPEPIQEST